jgi:hypothetical protein
MLSATVEELPEARLLLPTVPFSPFLPLPLSMVCSEIMCLRKQVEEALSIEPTDDNRPDEPWTSTRSRCYRLTKPLEIGFEIGIIPIIKLETSAHLCDTSCSS